jgi:D-alanine transaminase
MPLATDALAAEVRKLIGASDTREGMVYLQLTRGVSARNHVIPDACKPTLLFYVRPLPPTPIPGQGEGAKLMAIADERWKRCWIKSIALLPNVLAKSEAVAGGYDEAAFVENGIVTECAASNIFAVIGGRVVTHPVGSKVLPGITRAVLLECAQALDIQVDERPLREEEAMRADELFITSTTREVSWVARWNDRYIGQGRCGPVTLALHRALQDRVRKETITR